MEVATYHFRHSTSANMAIEGPELVARTLGVRLKLVEFRGSRANIGSPSEMEFGPLEGPVLKIISLDTKARAQTEYFSFVGPAFDNNLLTQNNVNALLAILSGNNVHEKFAVLFRDKVAEEEDMHPGSSRSSISRR